MLNALKIRVLEEMRASNQANDALIFDVQINCLQIFWSPLLLFLFSLSLRRSDD